MQFGVLIIIQTRSSTGNRKKQGIIETQKSNMKAYNNNQQTVTEI